MEDKFNETVPMAVNVKNKLPESSLMSMVLIVRL
jgi:hypothetical protein